MDYVRFSRPKVWMVRRRLAPRRQDGLAARMRMLPARRGGGGDGAVILVSSRSVLPGFGGIISGWFHRMGGSCGAVPA